MLFSIKGGGKARSHVGIQEIESEPVPHALVTDTLISRVAAFLRRSRPRKLETGFRSPDQCGDQRIILVPADGPVVRDQEEGISGSRFECRDHGSRGIVNMNEVKILRGVAWNGLALFKHRTTNHAAWPVEAGEAQDQLPHQPVARQSPGPASLFGLKTDSARFVRGVCQRFLIDPFPSGLTVNSRRARVHESCCLRLEAIEHVLQPVDVDRAHRRTGRSVEADTVKNSFSGGQTAERLEIEHIRDQRLDTQSPELGSAACRADGAEDSLAFLPKESPHTLAQVTAADDQGAHERVSSVSNNGSDATSVSGQPASR